MPRTQSTRAAEHGEASPSGRVVLTDRHLTLPLDAGSTFHYVWLRDNCWCTTCRVVQSGERRLFTADIGDDIAPIAAEFEEEVLRVSWNDGHCSTYTAGWLAAHDYSGRGRVGHVHEPRLWDATLRNVPTFDHVDVVGTAAGQLAQPLDSTFEEVEEFYRAYRKLGRMIGSDRYKVAFKTSSGDLITVHGHRVMHGRLLGEHKPVSAEAGAW